jgi:hypothetical protein
MPTVDREAEEREFRTRNADPPGTDYSKLDKLFGPPKPKNEPEVHNSKIQEDDIFE